MSADLLRQAAALMRERANAATPSADPQPGGWAGYSRGDDTDGGEAAIYAGPSENGYRTSTVLFFPAYVDCDNCGRPSDDDVQHIVGWHPAVALAVADLINNLAGANNDEDIALACRNAEAVARAYLGRAS